MSNKPKNVFMTLNCTAHCLILASKVTEFFSISAFVSLLGMSESIIKENKKRSNKILLLPKTN